MTNVFDHITKTLSTPAPVWEPKKGPVEPRPGLWTRAELDILERDYPTLGPKAVAAALGRPIKRVYAKATAMGIRYGRIKDYNRVPRDIKRNAFGLHERHLMVLVCVAKGMNLHQAAEELQIGTVTTSEYMKTIRRKLEAKTHAHAVLKAERAGLLKDVEV